MVEKVVAVPPQKHRGCQQQRHGRREAPSDLSVSQPSECEATGHGTSRLRKEHCCSLRIRIADLTEQVGLVEQEAGAKEGVGGGNR